MTRDEYDLYGRIATAARGRELPHARLDDDAVRDIRVNRNGMTAKQWAQKLGVHLRTIEKVRARITWTHV